MDELLQMDKYLKMDEASNMSEPCMIAKKTGRIEQSRRGRSLLRLPQTAVQSVSELMVSALQTGWQICSWKSSVSSTSANSPLKTGSHLESPEAEMLREVYLVLWAIRKQLRRLIRKRERRRRCHVQIHTLPKSDPVQGPTQDAQSPL
ncbi:PREDICTED: uncharacterized protein C7orf61 homolog [Elephantulus edwardii]|uniref:uncharacterized protein C7orf61 homolog n=1 Tax=Elephantulus edwardii TaxID=28737 RepID=UPI0003F0E5CD|nr:PREDICTED: uncharacterized protein C7orf61 homolog [Elephantulus edwardii]